MDDGDLAGAEGACRGQLLRTTTCSPLSRRLELNPYIYHGDAQYMRNAPHLAHLRQEVDKCPFAVTSTHAHRQPIGCWAWVLGMGAFAPSAYGAHQAIMCDEHGNNM